MARASAHHVIYLQLPTRLSVPQAPLASSVHFSLATRGRSIRTASALLSELSPQLSQVSNVVVLLAASDVTLLRMALPPLSATRLRAALPSLVEDHVIGDIADCAIAAGPETEGQRLIAVCDRTWLQSWVSALRELGARRIRVVPVSLCLPAKEGVVSAALLSNTKHFELALRFSDDEAMGLPIDVDDERELPSAVAELLSALVPDRTVCLSVPAIQHQWFAQWVQAQPGSHMQLTEQSWAEWIYTSTRVPLDLMTAIGDHQSSHIDWYVWRWPIALTGTIAVFNIIALNADWWRLRSEGMRVRDDIMAIYQRSFPNDKVVLDPLAQMNKKIAASRSASGQLNTSDFIVLSATLGEVWREAGHDLRIIAALEYRDGILSIKLKQGVQIYPEKLRRLLTARQMQLTPSPADPLLWQLRSL